MPTATPRLYTQGEPAVEGKDVVMADSREDQNFRRFYARSFSGHIVTAMLVGVGVLLATGVLDWLFQPDKAPRIWESRVILLIPLLLLTLISARGRLGWFQQPVVVLFTLFGVGALLEFGRLSQAPYHHYYNTGLVLMVMFCFVLTRIRFYWALLCSVLLFALCNLFWVALAKEGLDLVVIKNFILLVTCLFSLMAAWTVEHTIRQHYRSQQTLQRERDELAQLQEEHRESAWLQEQLSDYQLRISGDQTVRELMQVTMGFLGEVMGQGYGAVYHLQDGRLRKAASRALPPEFRHMDVIEPGEGLAGEAARQKRVMIIDSVPADYGRIVSATGDMAPRQLLFCPVRFQDETRGLIELALTEAATPSRVTLLEQVGERLGHALVVAEARHGSSLMAAVPTPAKG